MWQEESGIQQLRRVYCGDESSGVVSVVSEKLGGVQGQCLCVYVFDK